jgi:transposase
VFFRPPDGEQHRAPVACFALSSGYRSHRTSPSANFTSAPPAVKNYIKEFTTMSVLVRPSAQSGVHDAARQLFCVGVDVSKLTFDAAVSPVGAVPESLSRLPVSSFQMTQAGAEDFKNWLSSCLLGVSPNTIVIEATGVYSKRFAELIRPLAIAPVSTVNPRYPHDFKRSLGVKDKTDAVDARILAVYGAMRTPKPDREVSAKEAHLKELHRLCDDTTQDIAAWKNRLEQASTASVLSIINATIRSLEKHLEKAQLEIKKLVASDERLSRDLNLICSVPGIGEKTAIMLLAELWDLRLWKRSNIVSYCGLFPRCHSSGTSVSKRPRLAKGGGARIRRGLFMCALSATRTKSKLAEFNRHLLQNGKTKMCAIGALMRKLLLTARAVVISGKPYLPHFPLNPTQSP